MILILLLSFIAGCVYMMRGGSSKFQLFSKPFGKINPENGKYKTPRVASVLMQIVIITPLVIYYDINPWLVLLYPIGWYATIARAWGKNFQVRSWKEAGNFFVRLLDSFVLFALIALFLDFHWYSLFLPAQYAVFFAAVTVAVYKAYNLLPTKYRQDDGFNWSEFITGIILAGMSFDLILRLSNG